MKLNVSKGNMYSWITHTGNAIKGACPHDCSYCYMKRWGEQRPVRLDEKELRGDIGSGKFVFVGSSTDMWADDIPEEWIIKTLKYLSKFDNKYLFQSKNPRRFIEFRAWMTCHKMDVRFCTTIETNRWYPEIMQQAPSSQERAWWMGKLPNNYVTIEPIIDFDMELMVELIEQCHPKQVNIGADSGGNNLPEPPYEKVLELISRLKKFTTVAEKHNLRRLEAK